MLQLQTSSQMYPFGLPVVDEAATVRSNCHVPLGIVTPLKLVAVSHAYPDGVVTLGVKVAVVKPTSGSIS